MPTPKQPPAEVERYHLNRLEAEFTQGMDCICQFLAPRRALAPEEIMTIINRLQTMDEDMNRYQPVCQHLTQAGHNRLALRVGQMQNDLRGALTVYVRMYHNALAYQQFAEQIWHQGTEEETDTVVDTGLPGQVRIKAAMTLASN
jgi:hypothetical protein